MASVTRTQLLADSGWPTELWSEILPGLWQGGTADSDTIWAKSAAEKKLGPLYAITKQDFDTVITMYAEALPCGWQVEDIRYPIYDGPMVDVDYVRLWDTAYRAFERWNAGEQVLIRCQAGVNRSGLMSAMVLIIAGHEPADALALLREKRGDAVLRYNKHFEDYILEQATEHAQIYGPWETEVTA